MTPLTSQIADFLLRKRPKAAPTQEQYPLVLGKVVLPWCQSAGIQSASELTDRQMARFTVDLENRERKLSATTIQTYVRCVRIFLNWCSVPVGDYEPVHVSRRLKDVLSRAE